MTPGPLKYHGGKSYLAPKFVKLMPPHLHYVEPYAGGLAVLLARDGEGVSEVVNDLDGDLMEFWRAIQQPDLFDKLRRRLEATPFSEDEYDSAVAFDRDRPSTRAALFFIRCRQSLAGRMKDFATLSRNRVRRGMNEQVSAWLTAIEGLPAVHARLKRVVILHRDALDVIKQQDGPNTFFYLDPPYLHETRASTGEYLHEMSEVQHSALLHTLQTIQGKFMLSGYRSPLYDAAAGLHWNRIDFDLPNNASGGETKRRMCESIWMNYEPPTESV